MSTRIGLIVPSPEGESAMLDDHLRTAIVDLATTRPDAVVFGCTSGGALRGKEYEAELIERISDRTGAPTVSVAASVRRTIDVQRPDRVGVITPYVDSLNDKIRESLEADGVSVTAIHGLGDHRQLHGWGSRARADCAVCIEVLRAGRHRPVVRFLHNFRALDAREQIEQTLGVPVVTSNQAALAVALSVVGAPITV